MSPKLIQLILRLLDMIVYIIIDQNHVPEILKSDLMRNLEDAHKEAGNGHKIKEKK